MPVATKEYIADQFNVLLQTKNVDKITVKDVADACDITRQTFYYHFRDIFDVIEWRLNQGMHQVLANILMSDDPRVYIRTMVENAVQYSSLIEKLMNSKHHSEIEKLILDVTKRNMAEVIKEKCMFSQLDYPDIEMVIIFYSHAFFGIFMDIGKWKNVDLDIVTEQLVKIVNGDMFR